MQLYQIPALQSSRTQSALTASVVFSFGCTVAKFQVLSNPAQKMSPSDRDLIRKSESLIPELLAAPFSRNRVERMFDGRPVSSLFPSI